MTTTLDACVAPTPKTPRLHQTEARSAVLDSFEHTDSGQLIMACGTGKTLTSQSITRGLFAQRTLLLVPSLSLLSDSVSDWLENFGNFEFLVVCSDDSVISAEDQVTIDLRATEFADRVTTDPKVISGFLSSDAGLPLVVFSTYQSSPRIAEAFSLGSLSPFDLIIADEAHRCAGDVSSEFATVLDRNALPSKKRLFMTATPKYFTNRAKKAAGESDVQIASMDDPSKFGHVLHRLSFSEAIERRLLSDYQVVVVGVDNADHLRMVESSKKVKLPNGQVMDAATLASQIGVLKTMRKYHLRRIISFHSRVRKAKEFAETLPNVFESVSVSERPQGVVWADYVSGEMSAGVRSDRLDRLRRLKVGQSGVLSNARCLGEGVDVPSLDGVAFIDPRSSEVDIIQAVGRAIRLTANKSVGTIIIPVFVDASSDPEKLIESSPFQTVYRVVKALRAHDDTLAQELDFCRAQFARGAKTVALPSRIHFEFGATVDPEFASSFSARLIEYTTESWVFWYELLKKYADREGHCLVPPAHVEDSNNLGAWVSWQRNSRKKGELSQHRIGLLDAAPGWSWNAHDSRWQERFENLQKFVAREGHARVPSKGIEDDENLGVWVISQRQSMKNGTLQASRIAALESLPGWSWDAFEEQWRDGFETLQRFVAREGHARVPFRHTEDSFKLGQWVVAQRHLKRKNTIDAERIAALESLPGWSWNPREDQWRDGFEILQKFIAREGHARVPKSEQEDYFGLGAWVARQRGDKSKDLLNEAKIAALESLPGWSWNPLEDQWRDGFENLQKFIAREGHARVPHKHTEDSFKLGQWVSVNRCQKARNKVTSERIALLEALPGWKW